MTFPDVGVVDLRATTTHVGGGEPPYCAVNRMTEAALIVTHSVASGARRTAIRAVKHSRPSDQGHALRVHLGLTGLGAVVIISSTHSHPASRGDWIRSNPRRCVGHLTFLGNQESLDRASQPQVWVLPISAEVLLTSARNGYILDCGGRCERGTCD